jgi:predicted nuclease of predicted toxin-antitoxin system
MKLLLDQNISRKLVKELAREFPKSNHVILLGLHEASDGEIWEYARDKNFVIVTQDSDFSERSILFGYPPKVIWLRTGNTSTTHVLQLLKERSKEIKHFVKDAKSGCLQIFSLF